MPECPPRHVEYASQGLAVNAVFLHELAFPQCPGYHWFPCADHFHVGHKKRVAGDRCKSDEEHRTSQRRLGRAREARRYRRKKAS